MEKYFDKLRVIITDDDTVRISYKVFGGNTGIAVPTYIILSRIGREAVISSLTHHFSVKLTRLLDNALLKLGVPSGTNEPLALPGLMTARNVEETKCLEE